MPSDIKECSLYSFTVHGVKTKTTPKDVTARKAAQAAQATADGKQDALTTAQLAAVNSGITAEKVAGYDAFNVPSAFSGSPEMDGTASPGSTNAWARGDHVHPHDTSKQDALTTAQQAAVNSGVTAAKVAAWDAIEVPTKTSDLTNDSGFITAAAIPAVPTKTSDLTNDSGFVTSAAIPDSTSDLTNDSGFITASDIPPIPSKTSDLTNDSGFITGYTETDPTVPSWAKAPTKPTYTASEVGALPDTTVVPAASSASPQMDGTAAAGASANYARADHVHPSDSSKQDALSSAQMEAVNSGITAAKVTEYDSTEQLGTTYASNLYVNQTSFNRIKVYRTGAHSAVVFCNLMISSPFTVSQFITIGSIDGAALLFDHFQTLAGQNGDGHAVLITIKKNGTIQIWSSSASTSGEFFRAMIPLVVDSFS